MRSERLFKFLSYASVFCGFFALWISGVFGLIGTFLFLGAFIGGLLLEGSKWQVSERLGTVLIVCSLPVYYALMRAGFLNLDGTESPLPGVLARLIVTLSAIKLLQRKSDRDWIFLYIMAFFEVLLAAGLSISALYLGSFVVYVFIMVCTIIVFEIRKTGRVIEQSLVRKHEDGAEPLASRRVPATAIVLIVCILGLAGPMFFVLPRVGGAGFGARLGGGAETSTGFSDTVRLGGIGEIQQNDEVIMRVQLEGTDPSSLDDIRWRGIALDTFDNQSWRKSKPAALDRITRSERDLIQVGSLRDRDNVVLQTVYLEPINSPVVFVLPRAVGIQGGAPFLFRDQSGSITFPSRVDRVSYRVLSDTTRPNVSELRADRDGYSKDFENYLQLPEDLDPRIGELALEITRDARNRYDAARTLETYLQTQFGYTLEQKSGGEQPLADFLFNVREGHCEYFATAMAVMLRTQGIATRVVNGFQRGDFNSTADVFVVRQKNAHSWVEVYFPHEDAWITFDPTPFAGQGSSSAEAVGIVSQFNNYIEALQVFWIQYFVAYDSAEQRSLFTSVRQGVADYGKQTSSYIDTAREAMLAWWRVVRGDDGLRNSLVALGIGLAWTVAAVVGIAMFVWLYRQVVRLPLWRRLGERLFGRKGESVVAFYERMLSILASKGMVREPHQTPLEFAYAAGIPEAVGITEKYNSVRFGGRVLSATEASNIDAWLTEFESARDADRS